MRLAALGVIAMMCSCISENLVLCGDELCPAGTLCVTGNVCAHPDELAACSGLADASPCHVTSGVGECRGGTCVVAICGDGIVEPPEVCDIGKLAAGERCSGDCLSNETCGNGVLDPEVGEKCDCGSDPSNLPIGCPTPNSDDPTAVCDTRCSRFCGDGQITGNKQCDTTNVPVSCTDVGYYGGTSMCTAFCTLDFSGCMGRCGDGVVDGAAGEACDGAPPAGTCLDFARDFGVLGCSRACEPDIAETCFSYGWLQLVPGVTGTPVANARGVLVLDGAGGLTVVWDRVQSTRANTGWSLLAGSTTRLVAASATSLGWFDGTWHDLTIGVGDAVSLALTGDTLFSIGADCSFAAIDIITGSATPLASPGPAACTSLIAADNGAVYTAAGADGLWRWDGSSWIAVSNAFAGNVQPGAAGHLSIEWGSYGQFVDDFDLTTGVRQTTQYDTGGNPFAFDVDGTFVDVTPSQFFSTSIAASAGFASGSIAPPNGTITSTTQSADGWVLAFGSGVYRLEPFMLTTSVGSSISQLAIADDDAVLYCSDAIGWFAVDGSSGSRPAPSGGCSALLGDPRGEHLVANGNGVWRYDPVAGQYNQELATGGASSLAGTIDDAWTVINAETLHFQGGTWSQVALPDNCEADNGADSSSYAVAGGGTAPVYVLHPCDDGYWSTVLRWDAGSWTQLAEDLLIYMGDQEVLTRLTVLADGTAYAWGYNYSNGSSTDRIDGTTLTQLTNTGALSGVTTGGNVGGPSANDVFIDEGSGSFLHSVGGTSSRIRLVSGPIAVSHDFLYVANGTTLYTLVRMPSHTAGEGI